MQTKNNSVAKLYIGLDIYKRSWKIHTATELFDGKTMTTTTLLATSNKTLAIPSHTLRNLSFSIRFSPKLSYFQRNF